MKYAINYSFSKVVVVVLPWFLFSLSLAPCAAQIIFEAAGATAADLQPAVDSFRAALGSNNGNLLGKLPDGRREVNWDGTPPVFLDPFPGDFFNTNVTRGVEFSSPDGTRLKVSGDEGSGSFEFEDVTAIIPNIGLPWGPIEFASFSPQKMFAPIDSIITDVHFFVPGTDIPAAVNAFGVVLVDVDLPETSLLELFGPGDELLFSRHVAISGVRSEGLSFLGVMLTGNQVATRARITAGDMPINTTFMDPPPDGVAIDDVIFSEPQSFLIGTVNGGGRAIVTNEEGFLPPGAVASFGLNARIDSSGEAWGHFNGTFNRRGGRLNASITGGEIVDGCAVLTGSSSGELPGLGAFSNEPITLSVGPGGPGKGNLTICLDNFANVGCDETIVIRGMIKIR